MDVPALDTALEAVGEQRADHGDDERGAERDHEPGEQPPVTLFHRGQPPELFRDHPWSLEPVAKVPRRSERLDRSAVWRACAARTPARPPATPTTHATLTTGS